MILDVSGVAKIHIIIQSFSIFSFRGITNTPSQLCL